jgi:hypothetical protein
MSKFKAIMDAKRGTGEDTEAQDIPERVTGSRSRAEQPQRRGRPPGKRSDPDFEQTTVYLRKSTTEDVKRALIGSKQDVSELVESLLAGWLKSRVSK